MRSILKDTNFSWYL